MGPNGAGKSTLLKMIAARELVIPPRVDFLYVEQEVIADDTPAVDAVLKADKYVLTFNWLLLHPCMCSRVCCSCAYDLYVMCVLVQSAMGFAGRGKRHFGKIESCGK